MPQPTSGCAAWFGRWGWQPADQARPSGREGVTGVGDQVPHCPVRSGVRALRTGRVSVVPYNVHAGHIIVDRDAGVTQGVRTAQPAVFDHIVFM